MTALAAELGIALASALGLGLGWLFGHRAGAQRERQRSNVRAVQLSELNRRIEEAAR